MYKTKWKSSPTRDVFIYYSGGHVDLYFIEMIGYDYTRVH